MTINNALASVAVKDIKAAMQWYEKVIGRPADATSMPTLAAWQFPIGGWLQVYALPERAGSCSCTLVVSDIGSEAARLENLRVATGAQASATQVKVLMIKNLDGNSIAFAQAPDAAATKDVVSIARATYEAYVSKDRAAIEALIADDFHFSSPLDNRLDRATYFSRCWPNSATTDCFDFIHFVPDGERVFVTYEGRANARRFRNTELLTIRDGRITDVEVYFGWSIPHEAPVGAFLPGKAE